MEDFLELKDVSIIRINGEIDLYSVQFLNQKFYEEVEHFKDRNTLIFDLKNVTRIDSSGIAFFKSAETITGIRAKVIFHKCQPPFKRNLPLDFEL